MTAITIEKFAGKMNRVGYGAFLQAMRQARGDGNRNVELCHWLFHAVSNQNCDISVSLRELGLDRGRVLKDLDRAMGALQKNMTETPGISERLADALNHAWTYATLFFGEAQIRTGHLLVALLNDQALRHALVQYSGVFDDLSADRLGAEARTLWAGSEEEDMRPMDGSGLRAPGGGDAAGPSTSLGRFSVDMTADAAEGRMDPVVGRDDEIRQIVDVLMRRRQNNPILTGEAGVGKTAVVEGFAQKLAAGEVPPALKGMRLYMLDIGAMQAGASMKGEFEQRLRSVIDEVQASPVPIILFIDEAHTLIGAGGAAGTGDAANLLKPALARGTLRTIGATTWAEYRNYFEKDPALTRRFQPISVDEPDIATACYMMRGLLAPMEGHHKVRISDAAVEAAVKLSARYLPARQLPDKAVSLLDTACARVAVSQSSVPARIADLKAAIAALETEIAAKTAERDLGAAPEARLAEAEAELAEKRDRLVALEAAYESEKAIVENILALRTRLAGDEADPDAIRADLAEGMRGLEAIHADDRMIWPHVDDQAVASVISDWTGIPAGRMVADELQAVLGLADHLKERVIGQDQGLQMIARRVETARAGLGNPEKPIGVFMLCGPSGVGKTETALALAETLYGGEQNVITINMSEFQEAHSVSLLKGAPPGYVGYGEGGRLTEAVRRKPYSVVLLDEMEKAHPDVHELFFQVFDKGRMEDGNGRPINFRNTLILMTSNVGTGSIMHLAPEGEITDPEVLEASLKEELLGTFPPALLGRIVTIPYVPLSREVLGGIARLKLEAVARRMRESQGAALHYGDEVIGAIVDQCRDPDSGGRMIDNIITNSILPDLSRQVLARMVAGQPMQDVAIRVADEGFAYDFN
ncbi:type VI secretion system ATPase TssH [Paracoccus siganidrum]|uniref:Type VI secretion system ATPase TssH n=1 Tax=Paracoccus siganidrum TaxID=1276757 RepID=A0A419ACB3_9RHOB|nr:type VI secretion system ATPase TssH [Paracoccus siganidrum]RJL21823.1 type VI secretion system ATPase TssH [Paracoccus siganidrum]RMC38166.1 type VI secretion system ATPase TssH [Paracoccus siganidrum]